jgi:hypothetical protein
MTISKYFGIADLNIQISARYPTFEPKVETTRMELAIESIAALTC